MEDRNLLKKGEEDWGNEGRRKSWSEKRKEKWRKWDESDGRKGNNKDEEGWGNYGEENRNSWKKEEDWNKGNGRRSSRKINRWYWRGNSKKWMGWERRDEKRGWNWMGIEGKK